MMTYCLFLQETGSEIGRIPYRPGLYKKRLKLFEFFSAIPDWRDGMVLRALSWSFYWARSTPDVAFRIIRDARIEMTIKAVHGASRLTLWGLFPFSMSETEIANYGEYQRRSKLSLG